MPPHDEQHADANDAIEALQAKVGVDSSAVTSSLDYRVGQLETGGGGMTVSSTAPSSPVEGDMWYDDTSGRTYVYYDDGSSQQWVEFGAPPSGIGKILQVVSTTKTDTFSASLSPGADTAITGLSATITPSSATSKILVVLQVNGADSTNTYMHFGVRLYRGATEIGSGDVSGSRTTAIGVVRGPNTAENATIGNVGASYLDSPATTSAITYAVHLTSLNSATKTYVVNRSAVDNDAVAYARSSSHITVMEVSA